MEDSELWLPQYAQQLEAHRATVLQQQQQAEYLPHSSAELNPIVAQHPQLVAQLNATFPIPGFSGGSTNCYVPDQFPTFASQLQPQPSILQRPSVVQQTPHIQQIQQTHFEGFNPQCLFPFPSYFGLPCGNEMDNRFQQQNTVAEEAPALQPKESDVKPFGPHDDLLFNQLNQFPYTSLSLEAMLKDKKLPKEEEAPFPSPEVPTRIIHECQVCQTTQANGLHFGARTCAACAAFFRRTISDDKKYVCKRSQRCNNPQKDVTGYRKICRACRLKRCMEIGMLPENVQHKRTRIDSPRFDPSRALETRTINTGTFERLTEARPSVVAAIERSLERPFLQNRILDPPNFSAMLPFYSQMTAMTQAVSSNNGISSLLSTTNNNIIPSSLVTTATNTGFPSSLISTNFNGLSSSLIATTNNNEIPSTLESTPNKTE